MKDQAGLDERARELLAEAKGCPVVDLRLYWNGSQIEFEQVLAAIKAALSGQQPADVAERPVLRRHDWTQPDGTKPELICTYCYNRVPITYYGLCEECRGDMLALTTPPPVPDRQGDVARLARLVREETRFPSGQPRMSAAAALKIAERVLQSRPSYEEGVRAEVVEEEISAWAFAHNVDGAIRNDLMRRIRERLALLPPPLTEDQSHEG